MHEDLATNARDWAVSVAGKVAELRQAHADFRGDLTDFSIDDTLPNADYSLAEFLGHAMSLTAMVEGIALRDGAPYVPSLFLETVINRLSEFYATLETAKDQFASVAVQGGLSSFDRETFVATTTSGTAIGLGKTIRNAFSKMDAAFAAWYQLRLVARTPQLKEFSRLTKLSEANNAAIGDFLRQASKRGKSVEALEQEVVAFRDSVDDNKIETERILKSIQTERKTIDENVALATSKIAELRLLETSATELSASVKAYKASFDQFDEELQNRNELADKNQAEYKRLHDDLTSKTDFAQKLISDAENLLKGATNVGLAATFSVLRTKMGRELIGARYAFYFSITLLVVLSLPIAMYVFPGLGAVLKQLTGFSFDAVIPKALSDHNPSEAVAQIAARALLLIPGIWLVRFTAARHDRLFKLREHYAFKYSVASSVEGFKKQAPDLKEAIAAAAFFELTFNPATAMGTGADEARHPNPAMEWVMKKLGGGAEGSKKVD